MLPIPSHWIPDMGAPRSLALLRLIVGRATRDWPLVAAAWVLLLSATALISATTTYGDVVAQEGIRLSLAAARPPDRAVVVRISATTADIATLDSAVAGVLEDAQTVTGGEVDRITRATGLVAAGLGTRIESGTTALGSSGSGATGPGTSTLPATTGAPAQEDRPATVLASYAGIERHARLIEGSWPNATGGPSATAPIDATLSAGAATSLGLKVGQEVRLTDSLDAGQATTVRLVGIWQGDRGDPYWLDNGADLDGVEARGPYLIRGPFVVTDSVLAAVNLRTSR